VAILRAEQVFEQDSNRNGSRPTLPRLFFHRLKPEVLVLGRAHAQLRLRAKAIGCINLIIGEVGPARPARPSLRTPHLRSAV